MVEKFAVLWVLLNQWARSLWRLLGVSSATEEVLGSNDWDFYGRLLSWNLKIGDAQYLLEKTQRRINYTDFQIYASIKFLRSINLRDELNVIIGEKIHFFQKTGDQEYSYSTSRMRDQNTWVSGYFQEGRFACAIATNQADTITRFEGKVRVVYQGHMAKC